MTYRVSIPARSLFRLIVLWAVSWLLWAPGASAQLSGEVASQRFDPAPGTGNILTTRAVNMEKPMHWSAGAMINYGYKPFIAEACVAAPCSEPDNLNTITVVENQVTADLLGALTIIPQLQVGLKIPVTWLNGQGIRESGTALPDGLSAVGLGDVQLEAKGRFYGEPGDLIALGGFLYAGIPLGNLIEEGGYLGNASASVGGGVIASGAFQELTWAANLGGLVRESAQLGGTTLGPEVRWSVGGGYQIGPLVRVVADLFGSTNFSTGGGANNIEALVGAQLKPLTFPVTFTAGGGVGLFKGIGTPKARALIGALYSAENRDRDEDGIPDDADACPTDAEDRDNYEDSDGCPDTDNDQDTIPDASDECPDEPEDFDNFEDGDGCPEEDNDEDGLPDDSDRCPLEPENFNDFQDEDGCPDEKDTDGDGVIDKEDECIEEPEDTDGFEDTDGCPDPDNDGDGVPDIQDECVDAAEDGEGEGRLAEDGCPLDTDMDGVPDETDECPDELEDMQGDESQRQDGCPLEG